MWNHPQISSQSIHIFNPLDYYIPYTSVPVKVQWFTAAMKANNLAFLEQGKTLYFVKILLISEL